PPTSSRQTIADVDRSRNEGAGRDEPAHVPGGRMRGYGRPSGLSRPPRHGHAPARGPLAGQAQPGQALRGGVRRTLEETLVHTESSGTVCVPHGTLVWVVVAPDDLALVYVRRPAMRTMVD